MIVASQMACAVWHGPDDIRTELRPIPEVVPGSALIEVRSCAVCGSDLRIQRDGNPRITEPRILGHEVAGEVVAVGDGVTRLAIGDRVTIGADLPCGRCEHCNSGRANCCDENLAIGYQFDGGFAQYLLLDPLVVSIGPVQKFSSDLDFDAAALAEPLGCCLNGYERAMMRPDAAVAIFGAGPIGTMLAMLAPKLEARKVAVIEPSDVRRANASRVGVDAVVDPRDVDPVEAVMELTDGVGADVVFTACPVHATHEQAIAMVAKRGVVNLFGGLPKTAPPISVSSNWLHYREAYVTGSHGSTPRQHEQALRLIEEGRVDALSLVSCTLPLDRIGDAFDSARSGEVLKVVVRPNE